MIYRTKKFVEAGGKLPNDPELIQELSAHTAFLNDKGKLQVCKKDEVKDTIRRSPDKADSLFIAKAFDVVPMLVHPFQNGTESANVMQSQMFGAGGHAVDYDPYDH
jgi:hypothetical protein